MNQDKNQNQLSENNAEALSFFSNDYGFVFIFKKTEKLATAVYMVTGLLSDKEPLKWSLRKKVSEFLSLILNYKDIPESARFDFAYNVKTSVLEISSFLDTLAFGGSISKMNASVIKQEFLNLINLIDSTNNTPSNISRTVLSDTFFDVPKTDSIVLNNVVKNDSFSHYNRQNIYHKPLLDIDLRDNSISKGKDLFKRSNRQNIIIGLLKKKKELTIKDIAQTIKDCSEKTIQRELISLIELGLLKRTGERRWSKYSLVPEKVNS